MFASHKYLGLFQKQETTLIDYLGYEIVCQ